MSIVCPCATECTLTKCLETPLYCDEGQILIIGQVDVAVDDVKVYIKSKNTDTVVKVEGQDAYGDLFIFLDGLAGFLNQSDTYELWVTDADNNLLEIAIGEGAYGCLKLTFQDIWENGVRVCEFSQTISIA
jgi:hypothetical protein